MILVAILFDDLESHSCLALKEGLLPQKRAVVVHLGDTHSSPAGRAGEGSHGPRSFRSADLSAVELRLKEAVIPLHDRPYHHFVPSSNISDSTVLFDRIGRIGGSNA